MFKAGDRVRSNQYGDGYVKRVMPGRWTEVYMQGRSWTEAGLVVCHDGYITATPVSIPGAAQWYNIDGTSKYYTDKIELIK